MIVFLDGIPVVLEEETYEVTVSVSEVRIYVRRRQMRVRRADDDRGLPDPGWFREETQEAVYPLQEGLEHLRVPRELHEGDPEAPVPEVRDRPEPSP